MKILRKILTILLSIILLATIAFFILKHNPKPAIISLERKALSEEQVDKMARDLVSQMSIEEKVQMMTPRLKSNLKMFLEIVADGMKYNPKAYQAGGNERLQIPTMGFFAHSSKTVKFINNTLSICSSCFDEIGANSSA